MNTEIANSFAGQLRIAADDPDTAPGTMREAMRDAAGVMDTHVQIIALQQEQIERDKLFIGLLIAAMITVAALYVAARALGWL
jgi:hypothetical protein